MSQNTGGAVYAVASDSAPQRAEQINATRPKGSSAVASNQPGQVSYNSINPNTEQISKGEAIAEAKEQGISTSQGGAENSAVKAIQSAKDNLGITYVSGGGGGEKSGGLSERDLYVADVLNEYSKGFISGPQKDYGNSKEQRLSDLLGQVGLSYNKQTKTITDPLMEKISSGDVGGSDIGSGLSWNYHDIVSPLAAFTKASPGVSPTKANVQPYVNDLSGLTLNPDKGVPTKKSDALGSSLGQEATGYVKKDSSGNIIPEYSAEQVASLLSSRVTNKEYAGNTNFLAGNIGTENSTGPDKTGQAKSLIKPTDLSSAEPSDTNPFVISGGHVLPAGLVYVPSQEAIDKANMARASVQAVKEQGMLSEKINRGIDNLAAFDKSVQDLLNAAPEGTKTIDIFESVTNRTSLFPAHDKSTQGIPLSFGAIITNQEKLVPLASVSLSDKNARNKLEGILSSGKTVTLFYNDTGQPIKPTNKTESNQIAFTSVENQNRPEFEVYRKMKASDNPVTRLEGTILEGMGAFAGSTAGMVIPLVGIVQSTPYLMYRYSRFINDVVSGKKSIENQGLQSIYSPESKAYMKAVLPPSAGLSYGIEGITSGKGLSQFGGGPGSPEYNRIFLGTDIAAMLVGTEGLIGKALPVKFGKEAVINFPTEAKVVENSAEVITQNKVLLGFGGEKSVGLFGKTFVRETTPTGEVSETPINSFIASRLQPKVVDNVETTFGLDRLLPSIITDRGYRFSELNKLTQSKILSNNSLDALNTITVEVPPKTVSEYHGLTQTIQLERDLLTPPKTVSPSTNVSDITSPVSESAAPTETPFGILSIPKTPEELAAYNQALGVNTMKAGESERQPLLSLRESELIKNARDARNDLLKLGKNLKIKIPQEENLQYYSESALTGSRNEAGELVAVHPEVNKSIGEFMGKLKSSSFIETELAKAKASGDTQLIEDLTTLKNEPLIQKGSGINERIIANYNKSNEPIPTVGYPWKDIDIPIENEKTPAALARLANKYVERPEGLGFGVKKGTTNIFFGELENKSHVEYSDKVLSSSYHGADIEDALSLMKGGIEKGGTLFTTKSVGEALSYTGWAEGEEAGIVKITYKPETLLDLNKISEEDQIQLDKFYDEVVKETGGFERGTHAWNLATEKLVEKKGMFGYIGERNLEDINDPFWVGIMDKRAVEKMELISSEKNLEKLKDITPNEDQIIKDVINKKNIKTNSIPMLKGKGKEVFNLLTEEDISKNISQYNTPEKFFGKTLPHNTIKIGLDKTFGLNSQATGVLHSIISGQTRGHLIEGLEERTPEFKAGLEQRMASSKIVVTGKTYRVLKDVNRAYQILELGKRESFDYKIGKLQFGGKGSKRLETLQETILNTHPYVPINPKYAGDITEDLAALQKLAKKESEARRTERIETLQKVSPTALRDLTSVEQEKKNKESLIQNKPSIKSSIKKESIEQSISSVKSSSEKLSPLSPSSPKSPLSPKSMPSIRSPYTKSVSSSLSPKSLSSPHIMETYILVMVRQSLTSNIIPFHIRHICTCTISLLCHLSQYRI